MELKNVNSNGYNDVINNLHPNFFIFFQKFQKLSEIKDFKAYFRVENP